MAQRSAVFLDEPAKFSFEIGLHLQESEPQLLHLERDASRPVEWASSTIASRSSPDRPQLEREAFKNHGRGHAAHPYS